jgi:hypothetical protein
MSSAARAWVDEFPPLGEDLWLDEEALGASRPLAAAVPSAAESAALRLASQPGTDERWESVGDSGPSWNVLTTELVSFPRHPLLRQEPHDDRAPEPGSGEATSSRAYAEGWLDRERAILKNLADAGYPTLRRSLLAPERTASRRLPGAPRPNRAQAVRPLVEQTGTTSLRRGARRAGAAARHETTHAAVQPRGLGRLLPGVATLAVLAGLWLGAGLLASASQGPTSVLPGSVRTPAGYVYVARPGDTLWTIATRVEPGRDPEALVTELESQIHGATLQPGMRLLLP